MTNPSIRFGLIGYGLFGAHNARAIAALPGAELRAVAVLSEKSRDAARDAHPGATIYADYRELLARDDIDAVNVVVPNRWHYEVGRAVLASERHLLLEKPMALSVAECDELVALAAQHELVLAVGHELRVSSLWGGVKELIDNGAIGQPRAALVELSRFPYRQGSTGWHDRERVGSWILEEPIHFFDLAPGTQAPAASGVHLCSATRGPPRGRSARPLRRRSALPTGRTRSLCKASPRSAITNGEVSGTSGTIWAQWSAADARAPRPTFLLRYGLAESVHEVTFEKPTGELLELADEIAAFVHSIQTGTPPPCTANDGRWSTLLCLAAEESVRQQCELSARIRRVSLSFSPQRTATLLSRGRQVVAFDTTRSAAILA
jgi:myo-inositol 2-dehydrogenase/D-chiro-inositol 1-dehydrogenase